MTKPEPDKPGPRPDDVLRRMLSTPPKHHKPRPVQDPKPAK